MDASDPDGEDTGRSSPGEDTTDVDADTTPGGRDDAGDGERDDDGDRSTDTGVDERDDDGDGSTDTGAADVPEPTAQSAALRRQQQYVGVGGALVAGVAFGVGTLQRFPDTPVLAALAGLTGTALVLWLVRKSIFPGEPAA
jgi:hypothetical protein